jgi:hypothetical protein
MFSGLRSQWINRSSCTNLRPSRHSCTQACHGEHVLAEGRRERMATVNSGSVMAVELTNDTWNSAIRVYPQEASDVAVGSCPNETQR